MYTMLRLAAALSCTLSCAAEPNSSPALVRSRPNPLDLCIHASLVRPCEQPHLRPTSAAASAAFVRQRRLQGSICADINGDGLVGVDDLLAVLAAYGSVDAYADLTGNPEDSALLVLLRAPSLSAYRFFRLS